MANKLQLLVNGVKEIPAPIQRAFRKIEQELDATNARFDTLTKRIAALEARVTALEP